MLKQPYYQNNSHGPAVEYIQFYLKRSYNRYQRWTVSMHRSSYTATLRNLYIHFDYLYKDYRLRLYFRHI